ncbi:hypothetical protein VHEMI08083 [[Torrubiella] hemipterigena]|uniref:Aminoglycoside phosphotransferase domain-containing protein n=1 Tax=[Torrubiella] hemipterigena TaxID=1531966 RepID=A0A0A1TCB7_9HYPO|nr:hypothetical protein VHEMI08083 [[Torrubiella] hemipterigena]
MTATRNLPSKRWTSFDDWDHSGLKERLEAALEKINKTALIDHAQRIKGQKITMSEPFSAGQYWMCLEMVAEDGSLVIARVRLPRHPNATIILSEDDQLLAIESEVNAMTFVKARFPEIAIPEIYAYEKSGSELATLAGASYMLIEGFYGNNLQDVEFNICVLPEDVQQHIMAQWASIQATLASITFPQIGSISGFQENGEPILGKLVTSQAAGELLNAGPFATSAEYFTALANATAARLEGDGRTGAHVFADIVRKTTLFQDHVPGKFPLSHMDMGTQNILVDDDFNFVAVIDWEFAQTAPWQVNHFPMPMTITSMNIDGILKDPEHLAFDNVRQQQASRVLYMTAFDAAEKKLVEQKTPLDNSFSAVLNSPASTIYACFTHLGRMPEYDADLIEAMVRLAYGLEGSAAQEYIASHT